MSYSQAFLLLISQLQLQRNEVIALVNLLSHLSVSFKLVNEIRPSAEKLMGGQISAAPVLENRPWQRIWEFMDRLRYFTSLPLHAINSFTWLSFSTLTSDHIHILKWCFKVKEVTIVTAHLQIFLYYPTVKGDVNDRSRWRWKQSTEFRVCKCTYI